MVDNVRKVVEVLLALVNQSALQNVKVFVNQGVFCTGLYRQTLGSMHICLCAIQGV